MLRHSESHISCELYIFICIPALIRLFTIPIWLYVTQKYKATTYPPLYFLHVSHIHEFIASFMIRCSGPIKTYLFNGHLCICVTTMHTLYAFRSYIPKAPRGRSGFQKHKLFQYFKKMCITTINVDLCKIQCKRQAKTMRIFYNFSIWTLPFLFHPVWPKV